MYGRLKSPRTAELRMFAVTDEHAKEEFSESVQGFKELSRSSNHNLHSGQQVRDKFLIRYSLNVKAICKKFNAINGSNFLRIGKKKHIKSPKSFFKSQVPCRVKGFESVNRGKKPLTFITGSGQYQHRWKPCPCLLAKPPLHLPSIPSEPSQGGDGGLHDDGHTDRHSVVVSDHLHRKSEEG